MEKKPRSIKGFVFFWIGLVIFIAQAVAIFVFNAQHTNRWKVVQGCGVITDVFVAHNTGAYTGPRSNTMIRFEVDSDSCDYYADTKTWERAHTGDHFFINAVDNGTNCTVRQVGDPCGK
jgi:hypothetical protein